jgi:hypothetical protein
MPLDAAERLSLDAALASIGRGVKRDRRANNGSWPVICPFAGCAKPGKKKRTMAIWINRESQGHTQTLWPHVSYYCAKCYEKGRIPLRDGECGYD